MNAEVELEFMARFIALIRVQTTTGTISWHSQNSDEEEDKDKDKEIAYIVEKYKSEPDKGFVFEISEYWNRYNGVKNYILKIITKDNRFATIADNNDSYSNDVRNKVRLMLSDLFTAVGEVATVHLMSDEERKIISDYTKKYLGEEDNTLC